MDEFDSIAKLFRPLATGPEALGLTDDAALLPQRPGYELVVTTDTLVEGVHFLANDPPGQIAQKLLRVNLSDLAAKGAEPYGYLLNVAWTSAWDEPRRTAFAGGLAEDQARFGLRLFGGDTVSTPGAFTVGATVFGWVEPGGMVRRSGARAGDRLVVSGTIGDGALGLKAALGQLSAGQADREALERRYRLPEPRCALTPVLQRYARAAADISDGLLADAFNIARASGVGLEIELGDIPLSVAAGRWVQAQADPTKALMALATGGDDYEIACAIEASQARDFVAAATAIGVEAQIVGQFTEHRGIRVTHWGSAPNVALDRLGWRHG